MKKLSDLSTQTLIKVNKHLLFLMQFLDPDLSFDMNIRSKLYRLLSGMSQKIEGVFSSRQVFTDFNGNLN
jgi:hypothetical protein